MRLIDADKLIREIKDYTILEPPTYNVRGAGKTMYIVEDIIKNGITNIVEKQSIIYENNSIKSIDKLVRQCYNDINK